MLLLSLLLFLAALFFIPPPARLTPDPEQCARAQQDPPTPPSVRKEAEFDVVVFGATGFTGNLAARYLARRQPGNFTFAIAGRNQRKLDALAGQLERPTTAILADAGDLSSLRALVRRARVVLATVLHLCVVYIGVCSRAWCV